LREIQAYRPIYRMGGITYGRVTDNFEINRIDFTRDLGGQEALEKLKNKSLPN